MVSEKVLAIINVSLGLIAFLLILTLFDVQISSTGKALEQVSENSVCFVSLDNQFTELDLERCCLEIKKQFQCLPSSRVIDGWKINQVCRTGSGRVVEYWINTAGREYCNRMLN